MITFYYLLLIGYQVIISYRYEKDRRGAQEGDRAFTEDCNIVLNAVGDAMYAIGGKWKLRIVIAIARGNKRFSELQRQIAGISGRVLSSELKELESNGILVKKGFGWLSGINRI